MMRVFPGWLVIWSASSGEFWAYPSFTARAGAVLHDAEPDGLAQKMHQLQQAAVDELLNTSNALAVSSVEDSAEGEL
jgi:hypothetical protein